MSSGKSSGEKDSYVWGIDVVRFCAAIGVAAFHLSWHRPDYSHACAIGWIGVQVFFVISGLVIAQSANGVAPLKFLKGRIARLYPASWCCLALSVIAMLLFPGVAREAGVWLSVKTEAVFWSALLLHGGFVGGAYWTLPIEIAFYGMVFGVLVAGHFRNIEVIALSMVCYSSWYIVALLARRFQLIEGVWLDFGYGPLNMTLLRHGPYFALGIFIWLKLRGLLSRAGFFGIVAACGLAAGEIVERSIELSLKFNPPLAWHGLAGSAFATWTIATMALFLAGKYNRLFPHNAALRRVVRLVGLMTYPYYLLHETVGGTTMGILLGSGMPTPAAHIVALFVVAIFSILVVTRMESFVRRITSRAMDSLERRYVARSPRLQPLLNNQSML